MPYACSTGDGNPVVVHLQQLDDPYEVVDFCESCWVTFILSSAEAMGMQRPTASGIPDDPAPGGDPTGAEDASLDGETGAYTDPGPEDVGAVTEDQRPSEAEPAPY